MLVGHIAFQWWIWLWFFLETQYCIGLYSSHLFSHTLNICAHFCLHCTTMYYLCLFCFKRPASLQSTTPWRMLAEALPPPAWVLSHMLLSPQVPDQITAQAGMTSTQFYPVDVRVSHFCRATTSKLESDPLVTSAPSRSTQASSYDKTHRGIFTANPRSG